ncbi:MAG: GNAT family N-acetyltransferase [Candidatus Hodarchaeota archaeon]
MRLEKRGLKASEYPDQLFPLLEACFTGSKEDKRFYKLHYERPYSEPSYDYSRVGLLGGKIISQVGIWRFDMQITDGVIISGGGIRDVSTYPEHRKKGYGHQVLSDSVDFMKNEKIDISILYAGPIKFYEQKGWKVGIPAQLYELDSKILREKSRKNSEFYLEQLDSADQDVISQLYQIRKDTNEKLNFVVRRSLEYFTRVIDVNFKYPWENNSVFLIRKRGSGGILGYLLGKTAEDTKTMEIIETRVRHEAIQELYTDILKELAEKHAISKFKIKLSKNHNIVRVALELGAIDQTSIFSGLIMQVISRTSFMIKIIAALNMMKIPWDRIEKNQEFIIKFEDGDEEVFLIRMNESEEDGFVKIDIETGIFEPDGNESRIVINSEALVLLLFSPVMSIDEAIEDELIAVENVDPKVLEVLFKQFTWDKELGDYF